MLPIKAWLNGLLLCREMYSPDYGNMCVHTVLDSGPGVETLPPLQQDDHASNEDHAIMAEAYDLLAPLGPLPIAPPPPPSPPQHFPALSVGLASGQQPCPEALTVYGNAGVHGHVSALSWSNWSDETLKHDISPYCANALSTIKQLKLVEFNYNSDSTGQRQLGVLAQQISQVEPQAVEKDSQSGYLKVNLNRLMYLTIKACQELDSRVGQLESRYGGIAMSWLMLNQYSIMHQPTTRRWPCSSHTSRSFDSEGSMDFSTAHTADHNSHVGSRNSIPDTSISQNAASQSSASSINPLLSLTSSRAVVAWLMKALDERGAGVDILWRKFVDRLGRQAVWECFQAAKLEASSSEASRTAGGCMIKLLNKKKSDLAVRYGCVCMCAMIVCEIPCILPPLPVKVIFCLAMQGVCFLNLKRMQVRHI